MKSFLIVDDDSRLAKLYKCLIRVKFGDAFIRCAINGIEGLERADERNYSLIISDINMPEMDGIDFHKNLKKDYPFLAQRTVFITGSPSVFHLSYFKQEKRPWLLKPFKTNDFFNFMEKAFGKITDLEF